MVTQQYLLDRFDYDQITGQFKRKIDGYIPTKPDPSNGYLRIRIQGTLYYVHRLIWCMKTGQFPPAEIEHIDQNRANNTWGNLKSVSIAENRRNRTTPSNNTSKAMGVHFDAATQKWRAEVSKDGVRYRLGRFISLADAEEACRLKRAELGFPETHGS